MRPLCSLFLCLKSSFLHSLPGYLLLIFRVRSRDISWKKLSLAPLRRSAPPIINVLFSIVCPFIHSHNSTMYLRDNLCLSLSILVSRQHLLQCLAHSRCYVSVCWMSNWMNVHSLSGFYYFPCLQAISPLNSEWTLRGRKLVFNINIFLCFYN